MPKVECQEFSSTFCIIFFFLLFYVNWIDLEFVLHLFGLILLVNVFVFQVSFEDKVNLVLANVSSNLSILHAFKPSLSFFFGTCEWKISSTLLWFL